MADPAAILADASAHGASMSHVRGLYALVPTGPVVAESLYVETCGIVRMLQGELDEARATIAACQGKNRFLLDTVIAGLNEDVNVAREERNQERERANEWLSLLIDLRNAATWTGNGTAPAEDLAAVLTRVDAALVRS